MRVDFYNVKEENRTKQHREKQNTKLRTNLDFTNINYSHKMGDMTSKYVWDCRFADKEKNIKDRILIYADDIEQVRYALIGYFRDLEISESNLERYNSKFKYALFTVNKDNLCERYWLMAIRLNSILDKEKEDIL